MKQLVRHLILLFTTIAFITLFLPIPIVASAADEECKVNVCDSNFASRAEAAKAMFKLHQETSGATALFAYATGNLARGNEILTAIAEPTPLDKVYLAWLQAAYGDDLSDDAAAATAALLTTPVAGNDEATSFLITVAAYLVDGSTASALIATLKSKGSTGWNSELDQTKLAEVVEGLAALYATANDSELRRLAEMNLDIIFSRFAALDAAGAFGGIQANLETYDPRLSPWFGWSYLLFGTNNDASSFQAPGLLLSGYCVNDATRGVYEGRSSRIVAIAETFASEPGKAYTRADGTFLMGGDYDQDGVLALPVGYTLRASVRFADDPLSFLLFTTRTNPVAPGVDDARIYATKELLIGRLGGSACDEPHVLIGQNIEFDGTAKVTVLEHGGEYFALRFLGGTSLSLAEERYAPIAHLFPRGGDSRGYAAFPRAFAISRHGFFALEHIPSAFAEKVLQGGGEEYLKALAIAVARNTTFTTTANGGVTYATNLSGKLLTYTFTDDGKLLSIAPTQVEPEFALRSVTTTSHTFIEKKNGKWVVNGLFPGVGTSIAKTMTLDFSTATKTTTPAGSYKCPDDETSDDVLGEGTEERMAYLAASLLKEQEAYVLECGPTGEILASPESVLNAEIEHACVMIAGTKRTVGLLYDTTAAGSLQAAIGTVKNYHPFINMNNIRTDICDSKADELALAFVSCGTIGEVSVWLNTEAGIIVFSEDTNPFTNSDGTLDDLWDWLGSLFNVDEAGADPSTLVAFDHGYFYKKDSAEMNARLLAGSGTIRLEHMANASGLATLLGGEYGAGGTTQVIAVRGAEDAAWRDVTAALRITSQSDVVFPERCGNGVVESGEECDTLFEDEIVGFCEGGGTMTCTTECTFKVTDCDAVCPDEDGDGYTPSSDTRCQDPGDCNDADPLVYPDANEICDCVDNDCDGSLGACPTDELDDCLDAGEPGECDEQVDSACPFVCDSEIIIGSPVPNCPTGFIVNSALGHYNFSTSIDDDGKPLLKVTADGMKANPENSASPLCKLGSSGANFPKKVKIVKWTGVEGTQTMLFNYEYEVCKTQDENNKCIDWYYFKVKAIESGMGWNIRFSNNYAGAPVGWPFKCWGVQAKRYDKTILHTIVPSDEQVCMQYVCIPQNPLFYECDQTMDPGTEKNCISDQECGAGMICKYDAQENSYGCTEELESECSPNNPCASDQVCKSHTCLRK